MCATFESRQVQAKMEYAGLKVNQQGGEDISFIAAIAQNARLIRTGLHAHRTNNVRWLQGKHGTGKCSTFPTC
jgi:hypothetical protein